MYDNAFLTLCHDEASRSGLLLWTADDDEIPTVLRSAFLRGKRKSAVPLMAPDGEGGVERASVDGWWLNAADASAALAPLPIGLLDDISPSLAVWALASKWVVEAVVRQLAVPSLSRIDDQGTCEAHWRAAPVRPEDRSRLAGLAAAMPGVARAWPLADDDRVLTPTGALSSFLDAAIDGLMRARTQETAPHPAVGPDWVRRVGAALSGPERQLVLRGLADRHLPEALDRWVAPATSIGGGGRPLVGFRLEEPTNKRTDWQVSFHLINLGDERRVAVSSLRAGDPEARDAAAKMVKPAETLLESLGRCARVFPPISRALTETLPAVVTLDATEAWSFLTREAVRFQRAGYWVDVPAALSRVGRRRVRARMRMGAEDGPAGRGGLLAGMVSYQWEASLGADTLTPEEFRTLAAAKAPLVLHRGQWVAVDPEDVERLQQLMARGGGELDAAEALRLALAGEVAVPGAPDASADVIGDGAVARALQVLREGVTGEIKAGSAPDGLVGTLRPYQLRGLAWLHSVTTTGFGACLADDMGLGKTIQVLAMMQEMVERKHGKRFLVVCPTSVLGNWRREIGRFTPEMAALIHHGPSRASGVRALQKRLSAAAGAGRGAVVITSYALARRDINLFKGMTFDVVVLDEAQNIKNPEAAQSKAVRDLKARRRVALTGTPVENRLTELWSIVDFLNPGLLGTRTSFKKAFAIPVERYGDRDAAEQLRRVTAPFILRRLKTDPTIAPDLPEKSEVVRYCPLTREQAALYQATLDHAMSEISGMKQGMERRGRILAMLTALKQICNHPAHYLRDGRIENKRSGKLTRFMELFEEVRETGGHPLVFTQYREMGELLQTTLERRLGRSVPFYHGGLPRMARERMVASFQDKNGPPAMIVSLKAGGTGLNLTRANHVFHYDRWWNPAVEDQATDRAFRIGQTRDVTVHRMVSQGTLEEQIHQILEDKRSLADKVVGTGETWLSELDDAMLHELVSLGQDAVLEEDA